MTIDKFYKHLDQHKYGQYLTNEIDEALKKYTDRKLFYFATLQLLGDSSPSEKQYYVLSNGLHVYKFPYDEAEIVGVLNSDNSTLLINGIPVEVGMRLKKEDSIQVSKKPDFPKKTFIEIFLKLPVHNEIKY